MIRVLPAWHGIFVATAGGISTAVVLVRALGWTLLAFGTVLLAESMLVIPLLALVAFARPRTAQRRWWAPEQPRGQVGRKPLSAITGGFGLVGDSGWQPHHADDV